MSKPAFDYRSLSVDDRLRLVGDIWDSIAEEANANPALLPLTEAQKAELDRRIAEYDADPSTGVPMDQALKSIRHRLRKGRR
jgi:putative addiction module component (TIGR02574 family)